MLSFLNQLKFLRTSKAAQNPMILDGGRASLSFTRSSKDSPFFMRATIPPRLSSEMPPSDSSSFPHQKSSHLIPPPHFHALQDETFQVVSGRMVATVSDRQKIVDEENSVFIPRGDYHTFGNASAERPLVVDVKLDPDNRLRDERFFRNAYGYYDDVTNAGRNPSPFQALLLMWSADVSPAIPGPKWLMAPVSRFLTWFGGVAVGKWILGYREWYAEYTPEELKTV